MDQQPPAAPQQPMQPMQQPSVNQMPADNPGKGLGIAGLITSFFIPLVGLILSIIALNKSKKAGFSNGLALGGVIISVLGIIASIIGGIILILGATALVQKCEELGPGTHYVDGVTYTCDN